MFCQSNKHKSEIAGAASVWQLAAALAFAACNMLYYLLYNRIVAACTGDIVLWSSIGSGVYLCALGAGILASGGRDQDGLSMRIAHLEILLSLIAPLAIVGLYIGHMLYRIYLYDFGQLQDETWPRSAYFGMLAQLPLGWLGFLSGLEAGCINLLGARRGLRRIQIFVAIYYFGGLLGTGALLLGLAPRFDPLPIVFGAAAVNLLAVFVWTRGSLQQPLRALFAAGTILGMLSWGVVKGELGQLQRQNFYYNQYSWNMDGAGQMTFKFPDGLLDWTRKAKTFPQVERLLGPYQVIDFVRSSSKPEAWVMTMDGRFQVSSEHEGDYHRTLAHFPSLIEGQRPQRVLIVGGGDGLLVHELLSRPAEPSKITVVDIDPKIIELARQHPLLSEANGHALDQPQVEVVVADAFQFLRQHVATYDRIYLDVLFPYNFESSRLFSVEFLALALKRLAATGSITMLSPIDIEQELTGAAPDQARIALQSTLAAVGCPAQLLFAEERHSFLACYRQLPRIDSDITESAAYQEIFGAQKPVRFKVLDPLYRAAAVNSVLKPSFYGYRDTFF